MIFFAGGGREGGLCILMIFCRWGEGGGSVYLNDFLQVGGREGGLCILMIFCRWGREGGSMYVYV